MTDPKNTIAFQGEPGAYSDLACRTACPDMATLPCDTFEDTFAAVGEGRAAKAMIAIDNSVAGRVADVHHLMPESGLHIVGEHFQRVVHHLLAPKGATLQTLKAVHSHVHALPQCRKLIRELGLKAGRARRHRRCRRRRGEARRSHAGGHRLRARRPDLRPRQLARRRRRQRPTTPRAS